MKSTSTEVTQKVSKPLEASDTHLIRAVEGWLELGSVDDAMDEVGQISLEGRFHPRVILARYEIAARQLQWELAYALAQGLVVLTPNEPVGWINRSIALHAMKRTPEALYNLVPAAEKFSKNIVIPYNLACYASQLGKFQEANAWLKRARDMDEKQVKWIALKDPDLQPLWEYLGRTGRE